MKQDLNSTSSRPIVPGGVAIPAIPLVIRPLPGRHRIGRTGRSPEVGCRKAASQHPSVTAQPDRPVAPPQHIGRLDEEPESEEDMTNVDCAKGKIRFSDLHPYHQQHGRPTSGEDRC